MTDFDSVLDELNYFLYALMQNNNGQIPYKTRWCLPALLDLESFEKLLNDSICYEFAKYNYRIRELKDVCALEFGRRRDLKKDSWLVFSILNILANKSEPHAQESYKRAQKRFEKERFEACLK